jgi:hypothetical protein
MSSGSQSFWRRVLAADCAGKAMRRAWQAAQILQQQVQVAQGHSGQAAFCAAAAAAVPASAQTPASSQEAGSRQGQNRSEGPSSWMEHTRSQFSIRPSVLSPVFYTYNEEQQSHVRRELLHKMLDAHKLLSREIDGFDEHQVPSTLPL